MVVVVVVVAVGVDWFESSLVIRLATLAKVDFMKG